MIRNHLTPDAVVPQLDPGEVPGQCRFCGSVNTFAHHVPGSSNVRIVCNACQAIGPVGDSLKDAVSQWAGDRLKVGTPRLTPVPTGTPMEQGVSAGVLRDDAERVLLGHYGNVQGYGLMLFSTAPGSAKTEMRVKLHGIPKGTLIAAAQAVVDQDRSSRLRVEGG